jgi:hypothetical protein
MVIHPDQNFLHFTIHYSLHKTSSLDNILSLLNPTTRLPQILTLFHLSLMTFTGQRYRYRSRGFANQGLFCKYVSEWNGMIVTDGDFKLTACSTIPLPMDFGHDARVSDSA